jgi:iron complex outermembrane receptor protein
LGDVLFSKPGITGSSFAPGVSSRPIIRGLDVNRVGIVDNGIGGGGASDLGEDHFVPVNPLATDQFKVIRGPATLRYGSQSIGGVVSSTNHRSMAIAPPPSTGWPQSKAAPAALSPISARCDNKIRTYHAVLDSFDMAEQMLGHAINTSLTNASSDFAASGDRIAL